MDPSKSRALGPFWHSLLPQERPVAVSGGCSLGDTSGEWARSARTVVIGLGLSGAACTLALAKAPRDHGDEVAVVGLDARGLADGATGRNGGHQFAEVAESRHDVKDVDEVELAEIEAQDVRDVKSFVESIGADEHRRRIGLFETGGVNLSFEMEEIPFMEDFAEHAKAQGVRFMDGRLLREEHVVGEECNAAGGLLYPQPAQMSPNGLVLALCDEAMRLGAKLFSHTRVIAVNEDADGKWIVVTEEGKTVTCENVVYATNGYGIDLLPSYFEGFAHSVRGQCIAAKAPLGTAPRSITYKYCKDSKEEYLLQRRQDGVFIFGGCRNLSTNLGLDCDDSNVEPQVAAQLTEELARLYPDVPFEVTHSWCGVMCFTKDKKPIVGKVPNLPNQYLSVGFCGHGMVRTFSCGKYIAKLILGSQLTETDLLISKHFSPERLKNQDLSK